LLVGFAVTFGVGFFAAFEAVDGLRTGWVEDLAG
jgi:hypothetical protein